MSPWTLSAVFTYTAWALLVLHDVQSFTFLTLKRNCSTRTVKKIYCVLARLTSISNNLLYLEIKIPGLSFYFLKHPTWRIYIIFCYTGLPKKGLQGSRFPWIFPKRITDLFSRPPVPGIAFLLILILMTSIWWNQSQAFVKYHSIHFSMFFFFWCVESVVLEASIYRNFE